MGRVCGGMGTHQSLNLGYIGLHFRILLGGGGGGGGSVMLYNSSLSILSENG